MKKDRKAVEALYEAVKTQQKALAKMIKHYGRERELLAVDMNRVRHLVAEAERAKEAIMTIADQIDESIREFRKTTRKEKKK